MFQVATGISGSNAPTYAIQRVSDWKYFDFSTYASPDPTASWSANPTSLTPEGVPAAAACVMSQETLAPYTTGNYAYWRATVPSAVTTISGLFPDGAYRIQLFDTGGPAGSPGTQTWLGTWIPIYSVGGDDSGGVAAGSVVSALMAATVEAAQAGGSARSFLQVMQTLAAVVAGAEGLDASNNTTFLPLGSPAATTPRASFKKASSGLRLDATV